MLAHPVWRPVHMGRGARRSQSSRVGEPSGRSTGTDCPQPQGGIAPVALLLYLLPHTETRVKETCDKIMRPQMIDEDDRRNY